MSFEAHCLEVRMLLWKFFFFFDFEFDLGQAQHTQDIHCMVYLH
jgi:hypothetical protein